MKKTAILFTTILTSVSSWAIPAKKGPIAYEQPDGSVITVCLYGDERHHVALSEDGYVLLSKDGTYYFAQIADDGSLAPSAFMAQPQGLRSEATLNHLRSLNKEAIVAKAWGAQGKSPMRTPGVGLFADSKFPATGDQHAIVILAEYQDRKFVLGDKAHDYFDRMLNEPGFSDYGATGSVRDWFIDGSAGKFTPVFDVYGPITLPKNMSYYGGNSLSVADVNAYQMLIDACDILDNEVDFSLYDRDHDGYIDNVYLYYAGLGEAQSGNENTVWPHSYNITYAEPDSKYIYDGVQLDHYATSNEWVGNAFSGSPDGIGTFVHEFSHVLGIPDLYSTTMNNNAFTPGKWSVMDQGPYNNNSRTPPSYGAFERNALGWLHPTIIGQEMSAVLPPLSQNAAFVIESSDPDEFFLLENRQQEGWDAFVPHHGMLIWHVQYDSYIWSYNTVNNVSSHQYVDIEEADGIADRNTITGDPYPGTAGITSFTADTRPSMKMWNGTKLNYPITGIAESEDGIITFDVLGGGDVVVAGDDDLTPFVDRKPIAISATSVTSNSFVAHWLRLKDAEAYAVDVYDCQRDQTLASLMTEGLEIYVEGLAPETEYGYTVRAIKGDEMTQCSDMVTVNTLSEAGVTGIEYCTGINVNVIGGTIYTSVPATVYSADGRCLGRTPMTASPGVYIVCPEASPLRPTKAVVK